MPSSNNVQHELQRWSLLNKKISFCFRDLFLFSFFFFCPSSSPSFPFGLVRRLGPTSWTHVGRLVWFFSSVSLPYSCLVFRLVFLCRSSVGPSTRHVSYYRTDRASKQQPQPLGTRPAPWAHVCFCSIIFFSYSIFSFISFLFLSYLPSLFIYLLSIYSFPRLYVCTMDMLQVIRDGWYTIPQLLRTVPLRTGTAEVCTCCFCTFLFRFVPSRRFL